MRVHHKYDYWNIKKLSLRSADLLMEASSFSPSSCWLFPPPMETLIAPLSLIPPTTRYLDYFPLAENNTFRRHYAAVLALYSIEPTVAAATAPADAARLIYVAAQEGVPTEFMKWNQGERGGGGAYCAPPLSVQLRHEYRAAGATLGRRLLCLKGGHYLQNHCLFELADSKPPQDWIYGPNPHIPGHRYRAVCRPGHQPTGDLLIHGREHETPLHLQELLHTYAVRQALCWALPHDCGGLEPSLRRHHRWRSRSWLSSYNQLASRWPDPEDRRWKTALGHAATHYATGKWRPPTAPT